MSTSAGLPSSKSTLAPAYAEGGHLLPDKFTAAPPGPRLSGILFVLYTGIPCEFLPQELGFGSGMTCALDWSKAVIDGSTYATSKAARNWAEPGRPCPHRLKTPSDQRSARHLWRCR